MKGAHDSYTNIEAGSKIQLETKNHIGEFYFYISRPLLEEYLESYTEGSTVEEFLADCSIYKAKAIYDWLKYKSRSEINDGKI
jgi:hypothetical protein